MRQIQDGSVCAADYHAIAAWGSTSLKAMRKGPPARVIWERDNPRHSEAMAFGTAVHCALLTPDLFYDTYAQKPEGMSFATKDGKAWREAQAGKVIISHEDALRVQAIISAVMDKRIAREVLRDAQPEVSFVWADAGCGEQCKGRIDALTEGYITDLKVSRHGRADIAWRAFVDGWMHQLAHYRSGAEACGLGTLGARLIVVEPVAPHFVYTLEVKPDSLDLLAIENAQTVYALKQHREAGYWPGTPDEWVKIEPPPSALIANTVLDNLPEEE